MLQSMGSQRIRCDLRIEQQKKSLGSFDKSGIAGCLARVARQEGVPRLFCGPTSTEDSSLEPLFSLTLIFQRNVWLY